MLAQMTYGLRSLKLKDIETLWVSGAPDIVEVDVDVFSYNYGLYSVTLVQHISTYFYVANRFRLCSLIRIDQVL